MSGLSKKEIGVLLKHVEGQGVKLRPARKGTLLLLPNGQTTIVHCTVSDHRAPMNLRARLRRAGVSWPWDALATTGAARGVPRLAG